jgi:RNA polymerase sigma-70 factor (ECF subfamily)
MATDPQDTEKELIGRCQKGDQNAFKKIYDLHAPKMYMVAQRYMNNQDDAQDVLQDAFVRIFKNLKNFRFQGSFEGWCRRILVNTAIEHLRKAKNIFGNLDELPEQSIAAKGQSNLELEELLDIVRKLPAGYRAVFNMYVIEGYSHKEIADELGITVSTSKSQLFKARAYLQNKISSN